ncbi:hypothetical protein PR048_006143 [Dryococelus australis]|uniref:Uncharacterized protein n=1 Tax=Dryococelus australis TaxID=614101 RepID=A0ABQ9IBD2_9NEOP|nr:hypothetical protein PR048_006143 [Dryococelus australis]
MNKIVSIIEELAEDAARIRYPRKRVITHGLKELFQAYLDAIYLYHNRRLFEILLVSPHEKQNWETGYRCNEDRFEREKAKFSPNRQSNRIFLAPFRKLMTEYGINHYTIYLELKASVVEHIIELLRWLPIKLRIIVICTTRIKPVEVLMLLVHSTFTALHDNWRGVQFSEMPPRKAEIIRTSSECIRPIKFLRSCNHGFCITTGPKKLLYACSALSLGTEFPNILYYNRHTDCEARRSVMLVTTEGKYCSSIGVYPNPLSQSELAARAHCTLEYVFQPRPRVDHCFTCPTLEVNAERRRNSRAEETGIPEKTRRPAASCVMMSASPLGQVTEGGSRAVFLGLVPGSQPSAFCTTTSPSGGSNLGCTVVARRRYYRLETGMLVLVNVIGLLHNRETRRQKDTRTDPVESEPVVPARRVVEPGHQHCTRAPHMAGASRPRLGSRHPVSSCRAAALETRARSPPWGPSWGGQGLCAAGIERPTGVEEKSEMTHPQGWQGAADAEKGKILGSR